MSPGCAMTSNVEEENRRAAKARLKDMPVRRAGDPIRWQDTRKERTWLGLQAYDTTLSDRAGAHCGRVADTPRFGPATGCRQRSRDAVRVEPAGDREVIVLARRQRQWSDNHPRAAVDPE